MARPAKQGFEYFPFEVTFFDDIKIKKVGKRCGNIAQLVVVYLYALVYQDKGYYLECDEDTVFFVAERMNVSEDKLAEIIGECMNVGLFDQEMYGKHQILTSRGIQRRFIQLWNECRRRTAYDEKYIYEDYCRSSARKNGVIEGNAHAKTELLTEQTEVNSCNNSQSKVKESKGKKRKGKESKEGGADGTRSRSQFHPPTLDEVKDYLKEKGYDNVNAEKWMAYYESNGWKVGKHKMSNWKASLAYWNQSQYEYGGGSRAATKSRSNASDHRGDEVDYSDESSGWD